MNINEKVTYWFDPVLMDETIIEKVKRYAAKVRQHMKVRAIVLYGSYARGTQQQYSDIDVAVVVDSVKGDYITTSASLFRLVRDVDARIEPILLTKNDKSGFLEHVLRYGKVIYQKAA